MLASRYGEIQSYPADGGEPSQANALLNASLTDSFSYITRLGLCVLTIVLLSAINANS